MAAIRRRDVSRRDAAYTFAADALTMWVPDAGRVINVARLIATGVNGDRHAERAAAS
jgi:hypothetical protein